MRNSVMDVKQVQRLRLKNFKHLGGEGQRIRWVVKEGIRCHLNLVKKDVRVVPIHANRRGVADEVDVVIACGKLLAELRGNDAGAAVSWVAGYADTHGFKVPQDAAARLTHPPSGLLLEWRQSWSHENSASWCCIRRRGLKSVTLGAADRWHCR